MRGSYRVVSMQLARYTELRDIFTEQHRADVDGWDVLDQAVVHILDLATNRCNKTLKDRRIPIHTDSLKLTLTYSPSTSTTSPRYQSISEPMTAQPCTNFHS